MAAGITSFHGRRTRCKYERVADKVPTAEDILLVPNSVAAEYCGRKLNSAGVWIKPPPPTAASIRPAMKEKKHKNPKVNNMTAS
jgi:hypothetical protein